MPSILRLCGVSDNVAGEVWATTSRLRIGRSKCMNVVLSDRSVSRHHAEIWYDRGDWYVEDFSSKFRTFVNGDLANGRDWAVPGEPICLHGGDLLCFGNVALRVEIFEDCWVTGTIVHRGPRLFRDGAGLARIAASAATFLSEDDSLLFQCGQEEIETLNSLKRK